MTVAGDSAVTGSSAGSRDAEIFSGVPLSASPTPGDKTDEAFRFLGVLDESAFPRVLCFEARGSVKLHCWFLDFKQR